MELEGIENQLQDLNLQEPLSAEFFLYQYKIAICTKSYSHDWTSCPFAHPTENARRRDPRKHNYYPTPCPDYKKGVCLKGDTCSYSHGVFERWLHPVMFKTRMCAEAGNCKRKCCFFAHSSDELREPEVFSPAQKEQQKVEQEKEIQAPRISNSITRSLGLNPKDPAMVNVQKLLLAFQNREQQQNQQLQQMLQNGQFSVENLNAGQPQKYDYGLDSQLVSLLGLQSGFNDDELLNLQKHFALVKDNNMFQQVLQNSQLQNDFKSQVSNVPEIFDSNKVLQQEQLKQKVLSDFYFQKFNSMKHQPLKPQDLELGFSQLYLDQLQDVKNHNLQNIQTNLHKYSSLDPNEAFRSWPNNNIYKQQSSSEQLLQLLNEQNSGQQSPYMLNKELLSPHYTNGNYTISQSPHHNGNYISQSPYNGSSVAQSPHNPGDTFVAQSPHQSANQIPQSPYQNSPYQNNSPYQSSQSQIQMQQGITNEGQSGNGASSYGHNNNYQMANLRAIEAQQYFRRSGDMNPQGQAQQPGQSHLVNQSMPYQNLNPSIDVQSQVQEQRKSFNAQINHQKG